MTGPVYSNGLHFFGYSESIAKRPMPELSSLLVLADTGNVGIGKDTPTERLDIAGSIRIASSTDDTCDVAKAGTIRFKGIKFQGCTSTGWKDLFEKLFVDGT